MSQYWYRIPTGNLVSFLHSTICDDYPIGHACEVPCLVDCGHIHVLHITRYWVSRTTCMIHLCSLISFEGGTQLLTLRNPPYQARQSLEKLLQETLTLEVSV